MKRSTSTAQHLLLVARTLTETAVLMLGFATLCLLGVQRGEPALLVVGVVLQGLWLQRLYCVGHFASHGHLFPEHPRANAILGQVFLWAILTPLPVFRKIHRFHHAANRRDPQTSALEVYVVQPSNGWLGRLWAHMLWYMGVFAGGWFIHSLVSVLLFLFLPLRIARAVSPAFAGWRRRDQVASIILFALPVIGQVLFAQRLGTEAWVAVFGLPLLAFAWVYSLQLYVYHYRTTMGPQTRFHARRLRGGSLVGWWLLNLNEHDTHHQNPQVAWYDLPAAGRPLPPEFAANQNVKSFGAGLLQQLRGPTLVEDT